MAKVNKEKCVVMFNTALTQLATCTLGALPLAQKKKMKDLISKLKLIKVEEPLKIINKIGKDIVDMATDLLELKIESAYDYINKKYAEELKDHEESVVLLNGIKTAIPTFSPSEMSVIAKYVATLVKCATDYYSSE